MKKTTPGLTKATPLPDAKGRTMPKKPDDSPPFDVDEVTAIPPKAPSTELTDYKQRMAALVATTKKAEAPAGGFLSTKNSRLSIGDVRLPGDMIRAIIIEYRKDNELYLNAYQANVSAAPSCTAIVRPNEIQSPWRRPRDGEDISGLVKGEAVGTVLVADCDEPQVLPGMACDSCRMLEWGSAKLIQGKAGSGKGKACRESRRLHLFAADQCTTPEDVARAPFMTLIPPPTSLANFQLVANEITTVLNTPIFGAVVEIEVKPHDQYLFMVHYKIIEQIKDPGILMALLTRHEQLAAKHVAAPKKDASDEAKAQRGAVSGKF